MARPPGPSVRLRFALSYAGFLGLAGALLLLAGWLFLLRYVPRRAILPPISGAPGGPPSGRALPMQSVVLHTFAPRAAAVWVLLLVLGLAGGWFLAGRMLAPMSRITAATRRVADGSLSHRIDLEGRRDEFRELADSFDAMLARLEARAAEQQRFAANASHELRTPLAVTQTLLDVARRDPGHDGPELLERLRTVNARAIDLTEALLLLSRADQRSFVREPVDLSLVAEEAAEALLPLAEQRGVSLGTSGSVTPAAGSPALLLQLVTNLVHNAVVHNRPEGGIVRITTAARPGAAVLTVENTGDELSPHLVSTLTEPFRRGTGRVRRDDTGVGLGLAIVASIARAHDGTLVLTPRPGGGLHASVRLPVSRPRGAR